jgi:uncharacterized protein (TIGR02466 family)
VAVITVYIMKLVNSLHLFPTPVLTYDLGRTLTDAESRYINGIETMGNVGNRTSRGGWVLDAVEMGDLKADLTSILSDAFKTIQAPSTNCNLYITQAWLNYTGKGEHHHKHHHPNSFYSAVLYLKTVEGDRIDFTSTPTDLQLLFDIRTDHYNAYNSRTYRLPVHDYMVVVFPSYLMHEVAKVNHTEDRVSLSFNSFITGVIGTEEGRNNLIL